MIILLAACNGTPVVTHIERTTLNLEDPAPLNIRTYEYDVLTRDNFNAKLNELEQSGQPVVFFGLTEEEYKASRILLQQLQNKIEEYKQVLREYRSYYETKKVVE